MIYLSEKDALLGFVDSLKHAASYAHAIAHHQANPHFLKIRDLLESMIEKGTEMATAKPMTRNDVIAELDLRKMKDIKERPN